MLAISLNRVLFIRRRLVLRLLPRHLVSKMPFFFSGSPLLSILATWTSLKCSTSSSFECVLYPQYAQDLVAGAAAVTDDGSMITLVVVLLQVQYVT